MMTYKTLKHCSLVAVTAFCSQLAFAGDVIVALSPYQSSQQAMTDIQKMTAFAIEREPNERVVFVDGYKLETLGKFVVPDNPEQNKRFSLLENKENISPVFKFGRKAKVGQGEQEPQIVGALLLPQLTQYIAENHVADEPVDLILIGSPFYDNPKEPAYSMAGGLVPSDGHLLQAISKTPYGTVSRPYDLSAINVHYVYGSEDIWLSTNHKETVKRFWTMYVQEQKGKLASFTANLSDVLAKINRDASYQTYAYKPDSTQEMGMIALGHVELVTSIYDRTLANKPLPSYKIKEARHVELGISWECEECDIDLYARPWSGADILSFKHSRSSEGHYRKDHRNSPKRFHGYETIEFDIPFDLRTLQIVLNFFKGKAPKGVTGEMRLAVEGQTFAQSFHIPATSGNSGLGIDQAFQKATPPNDHIVVIDPVSLVRNAR